MSNHVLEYTGTELDTLLASIDDKAPKASPALTGTPTAPTAAAGTNTTQIATTAFVTTAVSNAGGGGGSSAWGDITGKPTTLSGYGITDANISNGVITLGSNTITPLTSNSSISTSQISGLSTVATSGNYGDLNGTPTIPTVPTNISAFTNNVGYITSPFSETGTITSNNAGWYNAGTTITGTYALMGDMCILRAYAGTKSGWGEVHYTLPVAAAQGASTVAYEGGHQYIISTGEQSNISVCTIRKIGGGNQEGNDTIHFTLIYRYQ